MKNLIFTLIIGLSIFIGCVTSKKTQQPEKPKAPVEEVQKKAPIPWLVDNDRNIAVGDPIIFYNEYPITVVGKITTTFREYKDGKLVTRDSSIVFDYSVPALTTGKIVKVEKKFGKPTSFAVSFDENGDKNYDHTFIVNSDKSFVMIALITLTINGAEYPKNSRIDGNGSKLCRLLYYPENTEGETKVGDVAPGVAIPVGTKPIK